MRHWSVVALAWLLTVALSFNSFAAVSTPSAASPSNPLPSEDYVESDDFDTLPAPGPISDGGDDITNTIDYSDCTFGFNYTDMKGVTHWVREPLNSQGYASIARPSDFVTSNRIELNLSAAALPPSGKYSMSVKFTSNTGGFTYAYGFVYTQRNYENTNIIKSTDKVTDFTQSSGDFWYTTTLNLSTVDRVTVGAQIEKDLIPPVGGYWKVEFTRLSSSANTDISSAGSDMSDPSQDTAQNTQQIADNTQAIVDGQDNIIETIKEQIEYITAQIEAFWNQLAGEFTNLFNKMNEQFDSLLSSLTDQTDQITGSVDEAADDITSNADRNTNTITNGYDSSGLTGDQERLDQSLTDYAQQEEEVIDQVKENIQDFEYDNFFDKFTAPMADISYFLSGIYAGLKSLNIPIGFGLTLTIALLAIGYYRFKGGG